LAAALDAKGAVFVLELEGWDKEPFGKPKRFQAYSSLPFVERDLSCLADEAFEAQALLELLRKEGFGPGCLRLKDVYRGAPLPEGKKSLTVALTYLAQDATLTDEAVNERHKALESKLASSLPLEIRA
jgi:phenylalanyl-tRNA synthetase beta chain